MFLSTITVTFSSIYDSSNGNKFEYPFSDISIQRNESFITCQKLRNKVGLGAGWNIADVALSPINNGDYLHSG